MENRMKKIWKCRFGLHKFGQFEDVTDSPNTRFNGARFPVYRKVCSLCGKATIITPMMCVS